MVDRRLSNVLHLKKSPFSKRALPGHLLQYSFVSHAAQSEKSFFFNDNVIERMNREIRRRTRVVGAFPNGNSARMLVCARLRHVAGTQWGMKKYMNMKHLEAMERDQIAG